MIDARVMRVSDCIVDVYTVDRYRYIYIYVVNMYIVDVNSKHVYIRWR